MTGLNDTAQRLHQLLEVSSCHWLEVRVMVAWVMLYFIFLYKRNSSCVKSVNKKYARLLQDMSEMYIAFTQDLVLVHKIMGMFAYAVALNS